MGAVFIMVFLFINNSVPKQHVGTVNGLAVALSSIARYAHCPLPPYLLSHY